LIIDLRKRVKNYDIKDKRNNWIGIKSNEKGEI